MKTFAKKLSCIGGALAASALIASMMIAPAFAADPTYRSSTGQYTETVAYDATATETAHTEVSIDTKFHYLDYSPEIDVTYSWDENLVGPLSGMDRMSFMKKQKRWIDY